MKRAWGVAALAMALGVAASAQTGRWRISVTAGAQGGSGQGSYPAYSAELSAQQSAVGGLDATYLFGERVGLHVGLLGSQGKFRTGFLWYPFGVQPVWSYDDFEMSYGIAEAGPEFRLPVSPRGEAYAQLNVGYTFGMSGHLDFSSRQGMHFQDGLTYSGAFGYRHFIGEHAGLVFQGAVRRLDEWGLTVADVRVGIAFRF